MICRTSAIEYLIAHFGEGRMAAARGWKLFIAVSVLGAVVVVGVLLLWRMWPSKPDAKQEPERVFAGSSDLLHRTAILPTLDTPIAASKSAIWCVSLQLAWNRLKNDLAKKTISSGTGRRSPTV